MTKRWLQVSEFMQTKSKTLAYLISSLFVAFAAFMQISYTGTVGVQLGIGYYGYDI